MMVGSGTGAAAGEGQWQHLDKVLSLGTDLHELAWNWGSGLGCKEWKGGETGGNIRDGRTSAPHCTPSLQLWQWLQRAAAGIRRTRMKELMELLREGSARGAWAETSTLTP